VHPAARLLSQTRETGLTAFIAEGVDAEKGRYPYMASVRSGSSTQDKHSCGGVLISENLVLTAAHCVTDGHAVDPRINGQVVSVFVGAHDVFATDDPDVEVHEAVNATVHPRWNDVVTDGFDIAMLVLGVGSRKTPIGLPKPGMKIRKRQAETFTVLGWGQRGEGDPGRREGTLQAAKEMMALRKKKCNETLDGVLKEGMVCAYGASNQNACRGDSGGPLLDPSDDGDYSEDVLLGIVSFGSNKGCGTEQIPTVYTNVPFYMPFIEAVLTTEGQTGARKTHPKQEWQPVAAPAFTFPSESPSAQPPPPPPPPVPASPGGITKPQVEAEVAESIEEFFGSSDR